MKIAGLSDEKRALYCVAYINHGICFEYLHANSLYEAKVFFTVAKPGFGPKIIDVAQVVGYHVLDNHGDKLSV